MRWSMIVIALVTAGLLSVGAQQADLGKALLLYASFDEAVRADRATGESHLSTRSNHASEKGKFEFEKGYSKKAFHINKTGGVHGGALECVDVLPRNGRIFFPARGNLAYRPGGWGGAVSVWIKTNPDELLKTSFCDPVQITQKGANDGGIWFDFNNAKPRDLRMGAFPAVPAGTKGVGESDPKAPMVWLKKVGFKATDWHHVVINWRNFDTGKPDAHAALWIDGKQIGEVKDRPIAMSWNVEKAGIYVAVNYIGLLDELGVFGRELTMEEIQTLHQKPGILAQGKKSGR